MPSLTPVLRLPYPLLTETPDVPRDMQALATTIESSLIGTSGALNRVKKMYAGQGVWAPPDNEVGPVGTITIGFPSGYFTTPPYLFFAFADNPQDLNVTGTINFAAQTHDLKWNPPYVWSAAPFAPTPTAVTIGGLVPGSAVRMNYLAIEVR